MSFTDFSGNQAVVTSARRMIANGRFPHSVIIAGPEGAGKFTLAQMLAKTLLCLSSPKSEPPDFCGACANCRRMAEADNLDARIVEALEARDALSDADRRETRLFVQTHPDVLIIPPDPPQRMIKVDQVRRLSANLYFRPTEGKRRIFIFTASDFMKEAANALLKALEEPPEYTVIFLLSSNPSELLPTIRSRCITLRLAPLPVPEIVALLAHQRPQLGERQRELVAALCGGGVGRALGFDLAAYLDLRRDALLLLNAARNTDARGAGSADHSALFQMTESYRSGRESSGLEDLLCASYSLLQDVLYLKSGRAQQVQNRDIVRELQALAESVAFDWLARATRSLDELERSLRRNVLRPLALDAIATALEA